MKTKSIDSIKKQLRLMSLTVTVMVTLAACSHEVIQVAQGPEDLESIENQAGAQSEMAAPVAEPVVSEPVAAATVSETPASEFKLAKHSHKKHSKAFKTAGLVHRKRHSLHKRSEKLIAHNESTHVDKVQAVAQGSMSNEASIISNPNLPIVMNGPIKTSLSLYDSMFDYWPYGAVTLFIFTWLALGARARRGRKSRRLIYN